MYVLPVVHVQLMKCYIKIQCIYLHTCILLQRCSIYNQEIFLEKASFKISFRFSFGKSCRLSQKGLQTSGGSTKSGQVPN